MAVTAKAIVSFFMKITFDFPEVRTYLQIFAHLRHFQHDGAFDPFFVELAAQVVDSGDGACGVMGVGRAAAAAVQLSEAVGTFLVGVDIAALELIADG